MCRMQPCDLFMDGNNTRHLDIHFYVLFLCASIYIPLNMMICLYFRSVSKSSVVSSSSDSEVY